MATADDYEQVFAPLVEQARQTGNRMRLLYQFGPGFKRITPGALWADSLLGVGYSRLFDGCAVVSDIDWIRTPTRHIGAWMPCPVRVYDNDQRDDAIAWLTALPQGADTSARDIVKAYVGGVGAALWNQEPARSSLTAVCRRCDLNNVPACENRALPPSSR